MEDKVLKEEKDIKEVKKPKRVKVKIIANIKYGESIHNIGEKIYILASELKEFEDLNVVEKIIIEKEENDPPEEGE